MSSLSSDAQQISNSFDRHLKDEEAMNTVIGAINKIATSATTIPLSLFTSMMHQHLKKHIFLINFGIITTSSIGSESLTLNSE